MMKKRWSRSISTGILIVIAFCFNCFEGCNEPEPEDILPDSYPYDPEQAGAEIIESFDLSSSLTTNIGIGFACNADNLYILNGTRILIFNSSTLEKTGEIVINIEDAFNLSSGILNMDYTKSIDIAIFHSKILLSFHLVYNDDTHFYAFLQIDIDGNNKKPINFNLTFDTANFLFHGYDNSNDKIWIAGKEAAGNRCLYFFSYDQSTDTYTLQSTQAYEWPIESALKITDSAVLVSWHAGHPTGLSYIEKRDLNSPNTIIYSITVNYLGTSQRPVTMIPYEIELIINDIWLLLPKDGKIMLLKIRPI